MWFSPFLIPCFNSHSHSQVNGVLEKVVAALQEIFEVVANTEVNLPLIILVCIIQTICLVIVCSGIEIRSSR